MISTVRAGGEARPHQALQGAGALNSAPGQEGREEGSAHQGTYGFLTTVVSYSVAEFGVPRL
jgi:hypothetical protein